MTVVTVDYVCPRCGTTQVDAEWAIGTRFACKACAGELAQPSGVADAVVDACAVCGNEEMYVQRDFNRKIGVAIVVLAALVAIPTKGLSLLAAVLIDLVLYFMLPEITICYRCQAIFRGAVRNPRHEGFDMGLEDKYRAIREPESVPESTQKV